jgi:hypothetical protein|nr:MAG TPA: hypothetical protein [Caudoviricetes sp.]
MKINKEIVDFYTEIMNGAATESQLNLMLAMDIRGLAMDMKHRLTVEQMERIEKIINGLVGEVAIDSIKQILEFTKEK